MRSLPAYENSWRKNAVSPELYERQNVKFSLNIPLDQISPSGEFQSLDSLREMARAVEKSGASAASLTDHPVPSAEWLHNDPQGHDALDPFTALAFIAASTSRLKVFTAVLVLPYRNPFLTAKSAATLQVLSGGRLILGVGVGYQKLEFDALGVPYSQRGALMDEALETIRLAWAGGEVVKKGKYFNAAGNEPRPVPSPAPPIWIGGGTAKAIERAGTWGDGWTPYFALPTGDRDVAVSGLKSLADLADKLDRIMELRAARGVSTPFDVAPTPSYYPKGNNREEAQRYCEAIHKLKGARVTWINMHLGAPSRAAYLENVAWFGEEIISAFSVN